MNAPAPSPLARDFLWGAATASYQIEGYPLADGACPSNWHRFAHRKRRVQDGTNGDVACDHYHRWAEDIGHMRQLGLGAYRFSIAWPRVVPEPGRLNPKGLEFYDRLVDGLLEAGIQPFATLFHWDLPAWLEDRGGFTRREAVEHLNFYAEAVFRKLGDRVRHWISLNEPASHALYGYVFGYHAPGRHLRLRSAFAASHYQLLGHARLVRTLRQSGSQGKIGIANHQMWVTPLRPAHFGDVRAARLVDAVANRLYMEPLFLGRYPEEAVRGFGRFLPRGWEKDLAAMREPGDFLGINYYNRVSYRAALLPPLLRGREAPTPGARRSAIWDVDPEGLRVLLARAREEYGNPPVYITENGYPLPERPGADPLEDGERIEYLQSHIDEALRARREGSDLRGFFVWSLLDNFEWQYGNRMRFGLIRVDFGSMQRTWRRSASWYRDLIRQ
jgi:beta-glucosidase